MSALNKCVCILLPPLSHGTLAHSFSLSGAACPRVFEPPRTCQIYFGEKEEQKQEFSLK